MSSKFLIINIATFVFVGLTMFFLYKTNNFPGIVNNTKSVVSDINNLINPKPIQISTSTAKNFASSTNPKNSNNSLIPNVVKQQPVANASTPGPLQIFKELTGANTNSLNSGAISVEGVIARTNYERQNNGVALLTESKQLDASAQVKANDILARQYFAHVAPDGTQAKDLITDQGYDYVRIGENLALGDFENDADLLTAWMNSPGHRANILDPKYEEMGVGLAYGNFQGRMAVVAVQHFGRPRSSCPAVDAKLKAQVLDYQSQIQKMSDSLDTIKSYIDTTRANGGYVDNVIINAFNDSVTKYNALVSESENLRNQYNSQVDAFNICLSAL